MRRFCDWPVRLERYFQSCKSRIFRYGAFDCASFASGAVEVLIGVNILATMPTYTSKKDALKKTGGLAIAMPDLMEHWGIEQWASPLLSQRGDVVMLKRPSGHALGVVDLDGNIKAPLKRGLTSLPLTEVVVGWRIGCSR